MKTLLIISILFLSLDSKAAYLSQFNTCQSLDDVKSINLCIKDLQALKKSMQKTEKNRKDQLRKAKIQAQVIKLQDQLKKLN